MNKTGSMYLVDSFGTLSFTGDNSISVRLFPFGQVVKNGRKTLINEAYAKRFTLPHFKPPMKLGSHADNAAGGGLIDSLEVREDGLYALINTTSKGMKVLQDKDYGYHSPEVIWDEGWLEDPTNGEKIKGPLIIGMALLHTPHLGEAAALFSVEPTINDNGGDEDMEGNEELQVSLSAIERIANLFRRDGGLVEDASETIEETPGDRVDFEAQAIEARGEVARLTARLSDMERTQQFGVRVQHFATVLANESEEIHELLAGLDEEVSERIASRFSALYAQMGQGIDESVGGAGAEDDSNTGAAAIDRAVKARMEKNGMSYVDAFSAFRAEHPEVVDAYLKGDK
jgi:hypothetical protein